MPDCYKDEFEEACIAKGIESAEFFGYATREEYFYPEYFSYQPDYAEKLFIYCSEAQKNGFEFIHVQELVD